MSKKKKIIISVAMVLLLAATAYLNILLTNSANKGGDVVATSSFFTEYRTERATTREQEMLYLDGIITNTALSKETVDAAAQQKMELVELMEKELVLEGLIKAKGFEDVAVTMANTSDNINVIVKAAELTQDEVAQIYNVLSEEVGAKYSNIKIIPVE